MNNRNVILATILATACITYAWIDTVGVSVTPTYFLETWKKTLKNGNAVCNDGSPGIYYLRDLGSTKWIIFVEGGHLYCWDETTCNHRWNDDGLQSMSSLYREDYLDPDGLLSSDCGKNPDYCGWNLGYVVYCSSDLYSGTQSREETETDYHFQGDLIIMETLNDLLSFHELDLATEILLVGEGEGGVAVLSRVDDLVSSLKSRLQNPSVPIMAVVDSGWYIDRDPFDMTHAYPCNSYLDSSDCSLRAGVGKGVELWKPLLPEACLQINTSYTWECFFADYFFSSIETPILVTQFQYDTTQLDTDGAIEILNPSEKTWAQTMAEQFVLNEIEPQVSWGFLPGCYDHTLVSKDWDIAIDGHSLPSVVNSFRDAWSTQESLLLYDDVFVLNSNGACLPIT